MNEISVVVPVYGCRECLRELHQRLCASLEVITKNYEIILVNDGCPEQSWEFIKSIALEDPHVKGIDLSRNFGQIRAITAGLHYAEGNWIVVMDCDLQDDPAEIINLYKKAQEGYDVVFSRRIGRKDTFLKKISSGLFYLIYRYFTDNQYDPLIGNFSISRRMVVENYIRMGDRNRAYILFINWMGFKKTAINVKHSKRKYGKTSYDFRKQLKLATEILTTQSNKPLIISIKLGFMISFASIFYAAYLVIRFYIHDVHITGWTSTIVSIFFMGGIILAQIGIVGRYIGYVFDQTKGRPLFIVRENIIDQEIKYGGD